jgi:hypothetical protein
MLKGKDNLDYEYFNRYMINCGFVNPTDMKLLNDFFIEKLNVPTEYELDPEKVILLNELVTFCRNKFDSSNEENTN